MQAKWMFGLVSLLDIDAHSPGLLTGSFSTLSSLTALALEVVTHFLCNLKRRLLLLH